MSQTPQSLLIVNDFGQLDFNSDGTYTLITKEQLIQSNTGYTLDIVGDITETTQYGNIHISADIGTITLTSNSALSNAIILEATHPNGGIINTTGTGGFTVITSNGDINLLSMGTDINIGVSANGTPAIQQTQNVNIESFNTLNMSSGDMYFVSSDVISFVSNTGDIQFGTGSNGAPIIKFKDGNVLINQADSNLDYQVDIAITHESTDKPGYNGLVINTFESNVASDLTLQTSNTLGDGTQCILSLGSFGSDNPYAVFQTYLAYQSGNVVIRLDGFSYSPNENASGFGKDFTPADIGRAIYWPISDRQDTILSLGTYLSPTSDTANVNVSGTYTGNTSSVYLLQIDSVGTPNTFMWSNDGGTIFQQQFIPITLTPITLEAGLQITFTQTTGFSMMQQFTFQTKITAIVSDIISPDSTPEIMYTLQPFYSYIKTTTPSDIVIKTNNLEKMRITGDGAIGIQKQIPTACLDLNSNYNKVLLVNQSITGYQVNPSISQLNSGGYVIVWNNQDIPPTQLNFDVYGQRYLSDGSPYGTNFKVNNITSNNQSYPSVAGNRIHNSNHFISAWSSYNSNVGLYKVYCQIYHNNEPIRNYDIQIDSTNSTTSNQVFPKVAGLYNGNYVIVWNADDTGSGSGIYSVKGLVISDEGVVVANKFIISASSATNSNYAYVAGLPDDDAHIPNGFAVGYMTAVDNTPDPRYTIAVRIMNPNGTPYSSEIPITAVGNSAISSISDGLLSLSEINMQQVNATYGNGGFVLTFYRNYQADTSLYNVGDPVIGITSGATASISALDGPNKVITLQNVANRFLVDEEIEIYSSVPTVGTIIEKIFTLNFLTLTTANVSLDNGNKNVVAYRFESNLAQTSDAIWEIQVNTSPLFADLDRASGDPNIFQYKRPLAAVSVNNTGTACVSWSTGSIPSIYYQLINIANGTFINGEQRLTSQYDGLKQRDQVVAFLQSIEGNDYGFVISWDNQSLDLMNTGIYQQLIGYNHSLFNLEDGNSNFIFNHQDQCGIGTNTPEGNLHIKSQYTSAFNDPPNPTTVILQNTSKHIITNSTDGLQNITFQNGTGDILNAIRSTNSLRYDDLYPLPENLIGFYKFDESTGTQATDSSGASSFLQSNSPVYINTSAILENFDIENCWNAGLINNSLLMDGMDDYLFVENTAPNNLNTILEDTNEMSLSLWVNIPSTNATGARYDIVSNGGNFAIAGTYLLGLWDNANNGNLKPTANVSVNGVNNISLVGSSIINDDEWHHIAMTVLLNSGTSNCTINLYVDGVLDNTTTATGVINAVQHSSYKTYIGSRDGTVNFYRGYIDELRFYDTTLSADMILGLFNYGNPTVASKGSMFINPNNNTSYNSGIVIDNNGNLNNLGSRPLPYSILSGELVAYSSNTTVIGTDTQFTKELTVGDIITLDIANNIEYTVITIANDTLLTLDTRGYSGPEISKPYQSVLRRPSIFTFFDNGDNIKGNIDNYGNLIIGNGKASSMLEIVGITGDNKNIPAITLTNTSIENTMYSRKTAINFRGYNTTNILLQPPNLGHIEVGHDGSNIDKKGIMRFFTNDGTQENNVVSLTSGGYVGIGNQNSPLTTIHTTSTDTSNDCAMILQSNYNASGSGSSIFDERSDLYFAGLTSITETLDPSVRKKVLSAVSGSNDSNSKILNGRLDFLTNNDENAIKNGIETRLSITHTGNVGVNIINPPGVLSVAPELRISNGSINSISGVSYGGGISTITVSNNIFPASTEGRALLIGGVCVIGNAVLTRGIILSVIANNQFTLSGDYTAWNGYNIYVHYPGLNVDRNGYIGVNTTTMTSPLTVSGAITTSITTITSNITLDASYHTIICDTSSAIIGVDLPLNGNSIKGRIYKIKNGSTSGNQVVVDGNGSLIDGSSTYNIQYAFGVMGCNTFQSDGTNWWIV
jgi:hypothetical protein